MNVVGINMQRHFEKELKRLTVLFTGLCDLVADNFGQLVGALQAMDEGTLLRLKKEDHLVDESEILIEEECLKILALHQPVAGDLRQIVAILKINNDMERIGDLTSNIASRALHLKRANLPAYKYAIPEMCSLVDKMLKDAILCVLERKTEVAVRICQLDDEVDALHAKIYTIVQPDFMAHPNQFTAMMNYVSISRFLERIADHTTNIAEDLLYMLEGEIFRHREKIELSPGVF